MTSTVLGLAIAAFAALAFSSTASAELGHTYAIPSYKGLTGTAKLSSYSPGYWSSHASGSVSVNVTGSAYPGKVQYAPFAALAVDGSYHNLALVYSGSASQNWSDTWSLSYNGFKFRLCTPYGCGSELHIWF